MADPQPRSSSAERAARTAVVGIGVLVASYLLAQPLVHYFALLFVGLLLGLGLGSVAAAVSRRTHMPQGGALALVLALLVGSWAGLGAWMGPMFAEQFAELDEAVPRGIEQGRAWLEESDLGHNLIGRIESAGDELEGSVMSSFLSVGRGLRTGLDAIGETIVVIVFAIFLAAAPRAYAHGALLLLRPEQRARASEVLEAIARALRLWLLARLLLMCFVGVAYTVGLLALGVPFALPLGFLAGALGFIPFLGPTLAFIPSFAVALLDSPEAAMHVTILYLAIQVVEGNMIEPVVESRTVSLRPGLILVGQVVAAVWFGPLGIMISTPLVVIVVVLVQMLYLQDRLGEPVVVIGQPTPARKTPEIPKVMVAPGE